MKIIALVMLIAQMVSVSALNQLQWNISDREDGTSVTTAVEAQSFEARVVVDNTAVIVLSGVVCAATQTVDSTNAVWTMADGATPNIPILRNGVRVGIGKRVSYNHGVLYCEADKWYRWAGTDWAYLLATDPMDTVLATTATSRWSCHAPISTPLLTRLNTVGSHSVVLRLYDTAAKVESQDSLPLLVSATPQIRIDIGQ